MTTPHARIDWRSAVTRRVVSTLLLGLITFSVWFVLDAAQLYRSAIASPIGARRTVSIDILRPVVRAEDVVHLGGLVNSMDRILGRALPVAPGGRARVPAATSPVPWRTGVSTYDITTDALDSAFIDVTDQPTTLVPLVSIPTPSSAHPLTILSVGDSLGQDLGIGLGDAIGANPDVHLIQAAKESTGLADVAYYNWAQEIERDLSLDHPQIVVMMLGANDWQAFEAANGQQAVPGTSFWRRRYGDRVATIMREVRATGAHLVWVGLPVLGPTSPFSSNMGPTLNGVFRREVRRHPGVDFFSTFRLFMNSSHQFSQYLPDASGALVMMRSSDGVHFTEPFGDDQLGIDVAHHLDVTFHVEIAAP